MDLVEVTPILEYLKLQVVIMQKEFMMRKQNW